MDEVPAKRPVCEVVKVNHKLQLRQQNSGDTRNNRQLPRKAVGIELSQPRKTRCVLQGAELNAWGGSSGLDSS